MSAERFPTNQQTSVEIYGMGAKFEARLSNLSKTGARLELEVDGKIRPAQGDILSLTVRLPELRKDHKVNAEVVWTQKSSTGVSFLNADSLFEKLLAKTPKPKSKREN